MSSELAMVLGLLAVAVAMFALSRPRMDAVAVLMMVALPLTGVLSVSEALVGLSDPNVVLIAALFVIGEGLVRTGVAQRLGDWLTARAGASEAKLIFLLMVIVAGVGSFMSSTGVVAIFIPIVLRIARKARIPAGRLMMPMSIAALISGMMTLVATAPNLMVDSELARRGFDGFSFFAFTPFGVPILLVAIGYVLVVRRFLGGAASAPEVERPDLARFISDYGLAAREGRVRITPRSPWVGKRLDELDLRHRDGLNIVAIDRVSRFGRGLLQPKAQTELQVGDILLLDIFKKGFDLPAFCLEHRLKSLALTGTYFSDRSDELGMAQLMVPPGSRLLGKSLLDLRFRSTYDLSVLGLRRGPAPIALDLLEQPLRAGDTLLVVGSWRALRRLASERRDLILLDLPVESDDVAPAGRRAPLAIVTLALVVALMVTGVVPNVHAALIGCLLLGLFRCVDMNGAYQAIHWQSLILIVGMLPFSLALQRTGGVDLAADALLGLVGEANPRLALAAIFAITAGLGLFISNTATAVLMAPVALAVADELAASPYPFAMTVALAASAAFMTPVSSPVNTLVLGPGNYRFFDFVRVGVPLTALTLVLCVVLVPIILPP
jgi:di/tricarboxylate transporter